MSDNPTQKAYERGFDEARSGFEPVIERLRSENAQLSKCVDELMMRILDLNKANESLGYSYRESVRSASNLTKSLFELNEKYETLKDEADWRFGHTVERGEQD